MLDAHLSITTPAGTRTVSLADYLTADAEEHAHRAAYAWIKGLRHLLVDGVSFRERFTARGDSLWWFSEVYLHKTQAILDIHRAIAGLRELSEREGPATVTLIDPPAVLQHVASHLLARRRIGGSASVEASAWQGRLRSLELRARRLNFLARIAPDRFRRARARRRRFTMSVSGRRRISGHTAPGDSAPPRRRWCRWSVTPLVEPSPSRDRSGASDTGISRPLNRARRSGTGPSSARWIAGR